jgi:hypothetical protein
MVIPYKLFITIIFTTLQVLLYSQSEETNGSQPNSVTKNNVYEIEYQFPVMIGFSYFHNFGNKFVPGIGVKIGPGISYSALAPGVSNGFAYGFIDADLKARDLFSKRKLSRWNSYDLGINYNVYMGEDYWYHILSAKFSFDVKVYKVIRMGISIKVGDEIAHNLHGIWIFMNPSILFTF